jgi:hypothetical protein
VTPMTPARQKRSVSHAFSFSDSQPRPIRSS